MQPEGGGRKQKTESNGNQQPQFISRLQHHGSNAEEGGH
jgi:hypothetical protein